MAHKSQNNELRTKNQELFSMNQELRTMNQKLPPDVVLRGDNVSKKFCRNLKRSMWYGMKDLAANMIGGRRAEIGKMKAETSIGAAGQKLKPSAFTPHPSSDALRQDEFWALKNISFELKRGECLGLSRLCQGYSELG